jgi:uncharacterized protein (DUF433 family)
MFLSFESHLLTTILRSPQTVLWVIWRGEPFVERHAEVCSGALVFKHTRVPLTQVVEQFRAGVPFSEIAEDYPHIEKKALRYAQWCARLDAAPIQIAPRLMLKRTAGEIAHR